MEESTCRDRSYIPRSSHLKRPGPLGPASAFWTSSLCSGYVLCSALDQIPAGGMCGRQPHDCMLLLWHATEETYGDVRLIESKLHDVMVPQLSVVMVPQLITLICI